MKSKFSIYILLSVLFIISCDDAVNEDYERELSEIDQYIKNHNYTDDDKINEGFYMKTFSADGAGNEFPENKDIVITSITSYNFNEVVINTTDSALAASVDIFTEYAVYGPVKYALEDYIYGIAIGLLNANAGDSIEMVMSSAYSGTNYIPWVVRAKVHEIIQEDEIDDWENNMVAKFVDGKNYTKYNEDIYFKKTISTTNDSLFKNSIAVLRIVARYAEFKDKFSPDSIGRICYPLGDTETSLSYIIGYGSYMYPFSEALDLIAKDIGIKEGEQVEIVTTSKYAYGENGVVYYNNTIVPTNTPMHFFIDVESVSND